MKTAVVILNWNGEDFLKSFLPILLANTSYPDVGIYVVDNGSTDNSRAVLETQFHSVNTLYFDQNHGFAGGYNRALKAIEAEYYVLLNSDVEVTENWLLPLVDYMDNHADVAACQPKIHAYHDRESFEHAGAAGGFIDFLGYPFCRGRILDKMEIDQGQYDEVADIFWATGACLLIRAELFHGCGGFDDDFFAHMEEIDLCWRIKSRGYRIVCIPDSTIYHVGGGTLHVENPHKTYLNFRNNLLLLYKNLPQKKLFVILCLRFVLDYLAAFQLFVTGKRKNSMAVIQARKDVRKMLPSFKQKRIENLKKTIQQDISEIIPHSIVVNYYLLRKKKFSDLI